MATDPDNAEPKLEPLTFADPDVGVAPADAELSVVGAPPASQHQAT